MLAAVFGTTIWTHIAVWIALAAAIGYVGMTLFTVVYHRIWYPRVVKPRYPRDYRPRCSVIVPVKNAWEGLEDNIKAYISQEYADYRVLFSVESTQDPAYAAIQDILDRYRDRASHAQLVVAGLTDTCAQKNHNLLAALEHAGTPDVYVFADADIEAPPQWLQRLVLPLSDAKVTATSGFRWMIMRSRPRRQQAHVYENNFLYTLFTAACFFGGVGLWGGSMAIRRKDFEELQVAGYWARTAVDDMTLSQLLINKHKKAVLVPECVMDTEDSIPTLGKAIYWFERQSMFLKAYHKPAWVPAIPVALVLLALHALLPVSIVLGLVTGEHFFTWGGGAALIALAGDMLSVLLFPLIGTVPRFFRFFFWHILYRSIPLLGFVATLKNNTIMWGGVRYTFDIAGRVTRVQR